MNLISQLDLHWKQCNLSLILSLLTGILQINCKFNIKIPCLFDIIRNSDDKTMLFSNNQYVFVFVNVVFWTKLSIFRWLLIASVQFLFLVSRILIIFQPCLVLEVYSKTRGKTKGYLIIVFVYYVVFFGIEIIDLLDNIIGTNMQNLIYDTGN